MIWLRGIAEGVAISLIALVTIWLARTVGPTFLGYYAVTATVLALGSVLINCGMSAAGSQRVANDPDAAADTWWAVTLTRLPPAIAAVLIAEVVIGLAPLQSDLRPFLAVGLLGWLAVPFGGGWLLVARGAVRSTAVARLIDSGVMALLAVVLIRSEQDAYLAPVLLVVPRFAEVLCVLTITLRMVPLRRRPSVPATAALGRQLLGTGVHYLKTDLSVFVVTSSDRLFLYAFSTATTVGLYEAAYRIIQPFYSISVVVTESMYLKLAQSYARSDITAVFRRYVDLMCFATIPLGFALSVFAAFAIDLIYGPRFAEAAQYLAVLGWVITFGYTSGVVVIPFSAWNRPRQYGNMVLSGGVTNLLLNIALIPWLTGLGAAIATLAGKIVVTVVGLRAFRHATEYPIIADFLFYFAASGIALVASAVPVWLLRLPPAAGVITFGAVYCLIVLRFRWLATLPRQSETHLR